MFRDVEKIKKDIELLGIEGGYNVEQLLTPQDCRTLSKKIDDLQQEIEKTKIFYRNRSNDLQIYIKTLLQRIDKAIEWVNNHIETYTQNGIGIIDWDHNSDPRKLLDILKGSDSNGK